MRSLVLDSPAKVNLYLRVLGKRPDGYHELLTLFHRISLCDRITLRKISHPTFRLITQHTELKQVKKNLIYQAHLLLRQNVSWKEGVEVKLEKKIPIAGGLGGGSSNAAHFLLGMNRLFRLGLSLNTLVGIGRKLGADIPFFLYRVNQALGKGRGDEIKFMPVKRKLWFVLIVSGFSLSTKLVYNRLRAPRLTRISRVATITSDFFDSLGKGQKARFLRNDLYQIGRTLHPELSETGSLLSKFGKGGWTMSGSGPTMFSVHRAKSEAIEAARFIRRRKPGVKVFVCRSY
jgi:4-diphosphocytidyl-2-C-methyl-D-erythritol kinase